MQCESQVFQNSNRDDLQCLSAGTDMNEAVTAIKNNSSRSSTLSCSISSTKCWLLTTWYWGFPTSKDSTSARILAHVCVVVSEVCCSGELQAGCETVVVLQLKDEAVWRELSQYHFHLQSDARWKLPLSYTQKWDLFFPNHRNQRWILWKKIKKNNLVYVNLKF